MTKKMDEKIDGVIIIDAVGTILMVNKVRVLEPAPTGRSAAAGPSTHLHGVVVFSC